MAVSRDASLVPAGTRCSNHRGAVDGTRAHNRQWAQSENDCTVRRPFREDRGSGGE
jgi:hypothetical protein